MSPLVRDRGLGWFLICGGVFLLAYAIPAGVDVPESVKSIALSPDLWPRVISAMFVVLGVILLAGTIIQRRKRNVSVEAVDGGNIEAPLSTLVRKVEVVGLGLLIVYLGLVHIFGIPVASAIAICSFAFTYGERNIWKIAIVAVVVPTLLYFFFTGVAGVPIPLGIFGD